MFGGLGPTELIVIAGAALLLFGPKKLPELAKGLGRGIRDFKKALEGKGEEEEEKLPPGSTSVDGTVAQDPVKTPDETKKS